MASCLSPNFWGSRNENEKEMKENIIFNKSAFLNMRKWKCKVWFQCPREPSGCIAHNIFCCFGPGSCVELKRCTVQFDLWWLWQKSMANDVESWLDSSCTLPLKCCSYWKWFVQVSGKYEKTRKYFPLYIYLLVCISHFPFKRVYWLCAFVRVCCLELHRLPLCGRSWLRLPWYLWQRLLAPPPALHDHAGPHQPHCLTVADALLHDDT